MVSMVLPTPEMPDDDEEDSNVPVVIENVDPAPFPLGERMTATDDVKT